ncbi:HesA/MoeB/ThiF family protein [Ornithobacterium rhinotracheale]|uniref:Molybdopterin-synthase adenylyltransferase n=1 Tax=Ornithobacterium rhinotracheale (strain ATCC 51463 / DSM 15997 / CCUG 23171 / CIP 104009 / LMG 9086) TaxID=867902 RepID=I4A396_ORNRL|nr:HesA/MoeB/ThiF family protein [Ornithobacterium rhinotracheale]AFL98430.1 dinucleotide-utilizing enzyme possibly involved in molybdopterin or thiamin biosynthesis [Ornithobacterium rhinotracheale DSM 15997]AIQ00161.1 dinucleotide-utilizing protein [Ornithobacterium rhinotracheale ORT-UMN 88]KGB65750.1 dinucleotide-utilizing protein [Ornithobacterium rhinotracheale H06-030791]MCK0193223.1 HesA/MoeB/ThiF family protein [Ornithobacterium rhinotracheale]MCK0200806.1 HesA/MoeB/ThiF family protei
MLNEKEKRQYARHILLNEIGIEKQEKLKNSSVLVIGAGGLGCPILQYLAAAGVGNIGIIDPDKVSETNLHRQVLFTHDDLGKPKTDVAKKHLSRLNPFIQIESYPFALDEKNALALFKKYDLIVEGSDSFSTKYLTNDACVLAEKPFILGSIFKFEGQLSVYNYRNNATYRCLFPEPMSSADMPTCSEVGVIGVLPGVVGTLMANEAIKILTEIGDVLAGKLLKINLLNLEINIFEFEKDPDIQITEISPITVSCSNRNHEIDFETYQKNKENYYLLDVRTYEEREISHIGGLHIPLHELPDRWQELPTQKPLVVYCAHGVRSARAISFLEQKMPNQAFLNLENGISDT